MEQVYTTNISILCPADPTAYTNISTATLFTRIHTHHTLVELGRVLAKTPAISNTFCFAHQNIILVYGSNAQTHHDQVRIVLQMLMDHGMKADIDGCRFDVETPEHAGFKLEIQGSGDKRVLLIREFGAEAEAYYKAKKEGEDKAKIEETSDESEQIDVVTGYVVPKQVGTKRTGKKNKRDRRVESEALIVMGTKAPVA